MVTSESVLVSMSLLLGTTPEALRGPRNYSEIFKSSNREG